MHGALLLRDELGAFLSPINDHLLAHLTEPYVLWCLEDAIPFALVMRIVAIAHGFYAAGVQGDWGLMSSIVRPLFTGGVVFDNSATLELFWEVHRLKHRGVDPWYGVGHPCPHLVARLLQLNSLPLLV